MDNTHLQHYIPATWSLYLSSEVQTKDFELLNDKLTTEFENNIVYPNIVNLFKALEICPLTETKVVILGQDPYHGPGQAHGLSFSVPSEFNVPPSLKNIYKELHRSVNFDIPNHGNLTSWATQGVLLLNTALSVRAAQAGSHSKLGWSHFTDSVIHKVSLYQDNVVFLLWGAHAQTKSHLIDTSKHLILSSAHPSPLSAYRGFLGNNHFAEANEFLEEKNLGTINWNSLNKQMDLFSS